jgi:hypothetical protein
MVVLSALGAWFSTKDGKRWELMDREKGDKKKAQGQDPGLCYRDACKWIVAAQEMRWRDPSMARCMGVIETAFGEGWCVKPKKPLEKAGVRNQEQRKGRERTRITKF